MRGWGHHEFRIEANRVAAIAADRQLIFAHRFAGVGHQHPGIHAGRSRKLDFHIFIDGLVGDRAFTDQDRALIAGPKQRYTAEGERKAEAISYAVSNLDHTSWRDSDIRSPAGDERPIEDLRPDPLPIQKRDLL